MLYLDQRETCDGIEVLDPGNPYGNCGGAAARHRRLDAVRAAAPEPEVRQRFCQAGQRGVIGPTATLPEARGRGVGRALVDAALTWAYVQGYQWISVDFDTANPLSVATRP